MIKNIAFILLIIFMVALPVIVNMHNKNRLYNLSCKIDKDNERVIIEKQRYISTSNNGVIRFENMSYMPKIGELCKIVELK